MFQEAKNDRFGREILINSMMVITCETTIEFLSAVEKGDLVNTNAFLKFSWNRRYLDRTKHLLNTFVLSFKGKNFQCMELLFNR